ncbi:MAG: GTPase domain-containing protein [Candidatus Sericytochromatia bacterium]|nr:GTPase domain-containing protein [Candidatus Tanganyikabacteria bacterium]
MALINYASREINCKLVFYGTGLGGKTTNLEYIFKQLAPGIRGEMISLATETERTLFFDFLPLDLGSVQGFKTKFSLYTVPGQVEYNASRKLILNGVDGIVFVADSQVEKMAENIESLRNMEENLAEYGLTLDSVPFVLQYNKRDMPNVSSFEELEAALNQRGVPSFEAVAVEGSGVFATLKAISKSVLNRLS